MARPDYSVKLDTILASGDVHTAWRILTCDLTWPDGDPPYTGAHVSVPAIPAEPIGAGRRTAIIAAPWVGIGLMW